MRFARGRTVRGPSTHHIALPVKYRTVLLDERVTAMIQDTAAEIADRFPIEMEALGTDKTHILLLCRAHQKMAPGTDCPGVQEHHSPGNLSPEPCRHTNAKGGELWTNGYDVATVGERAHWQTVERDVQRQGQPREDLRQLRMF